MGSAPATAFVLGAGLGTRLRPLTDSLPKPLVPVFNKPLLTFAFDHLIASGVERFVVNTHHRPEAYARILGEKNGRAEYRGRPVFFRHEPVLLETGGGIKNAQDLIGDSDFVSYNGDVLAAFPLAALLDAHAGSGNIATLALRSSGAERRVQFDSAGGRITDLRGIIGGRGEPAFLFTGVAVFSPEIFRHIEKGAIVSVIPVLAELVRRGATVGGVLVDSGSWFDIGTPQAYLDVHRTIAAGGAAFDYLRPDSIPRVSPNAEVSGSAKLEGCSCVGSGARIEAGAVLRDTVVWSGARVGAGTTLENAVVSPDWIFQVGGEEKP